MIDLNSLIFVLFNRKKLEVTEFAFMVLVIAAAVLYGAWSEYRSKSLRDARLLAGVGLGGLVATTALYFS
ncbi:MAG: hypothetical protein ACKVOO_06485 [Burkholderiaceae bacterium]